MSLTHRTRTRLTAAAVLVPLLGLAGWKLAQHLHGRAGEPSTVETASAPDAGADALPPRPQPPPEQGVLAVTLRGAEGPARLWVTGLNVWPAREAGAPAGQTSVRITGLPEGEVHVWARTDSQVAGPGDAVAVSEDEPATLTVRLRDAAPLRGHVQSTSGQAVAGATVSVLPPEPGLPAQELTTDAQGDFAGGLFFEPVAHLWVRAVGHVDEVVEARPHQPLRVVLEPTRQLTGRVVDVRGEPVTGARVWAEGLGGAAVQGSWEGVLDSRAGELGVLRGDIPRVPLAMAGAAVAAATGAITDGNGEFVLQGLRRRDMHVMAEADGYARARVAVGRADPERSVELVLREGGRVFGTVRDPRGYEVAGIDVQLLQRESEAQQWSASDERGEFRFEAVRGDVKVSAFEHGTLASECELSVAAGDALDCALTVGQPRSNLQVTVEDERGQPVPGALVQLTAQATPGTRGLERRRLSGPDGQAVFGALPMARYLLELSAGGFVRRPEVEVDSESEDTLTVTLQRAGEASGTVVDSLGQPVAGAEVRTRGAWGAAQSDAEGRFVLTGVEPGDRRVFARFGDLRSPAITTRVHADERVEGLVLHLDGRADLAEEALETDGDPAVEEGTEIANTPAVETSPPEPPSLLSALELSFRDGSSVVANVDANSDVARAGFREGDVLTHVDGEAVLTTAQARGMLRDPPGRVARVRVQRGGRALTLRFRRPALR